MRKILAPPKKSVIYVNVGDYHDLGEYDYIEQTLLKGIINDENRMPVERVEAELALKELENEGM